MLKQSLQDLMMNSIFGGTQNNDVIDTSNNIINTNNDIINTNSINNGMSEKNLEDSGNILINTQKKKVEKEEKKK